jgi:hypothetical protein
MVWYFCFECKGTVSVPLSFFFLTHKGRYDSCEAGGHGVCVCIFLEYLEVGRSNAEMRRRRRGRWVSFLFLFVVSCHGRNEDYFFS